MKNILFILLAVIFTTISCSSDDDAINLSVGDEHQGGIIFYLDETGESGLIALQQDIGEPEWGCTGNEEPLALNEGIGFGEQNTLAIVTYCDDEHFAAKLCFELDMNGYDDWFLPSIDELELVYEHRDLIGNFSSDEIAVYSSSTEGWPNTQQDGTPFYLRTFVFDFSDTPITGERKIFSSKVSSHKVRPVRSF